MKLIIFAHKPPPHHGQSYMVQLLVESLKADAEAPDGEREAVVCYHVDARLSERIDSIGQPGLKKVFVLLQYCVQAIVCGLRYGVRHFYYIPAPGLRAAVYRDWIVMAMCRPFFPFLIYHWEAAGLGDWIETKARPWERWISRWLLGRPDLSIVLGEYNRRDARQLKSHRVEIVPNGILDPCPRFDEQLKSRRIDRATARRKLLKAWTGDDTMFRDCPDEAREFRVLFIGLCHRTKGMFDTIEAVALVNRKLQQTPLRISLSVAGGFWMESERVEFEERIRQPDLVRDGKPLVSYVGFVSGEEKKRLFCESDCLCFPTYYPAEALPLVVAEGMAFGLPIVASTWRTVPELLPEAYPGLVEPQSPDQIAARLESFIGREYDPTLRTRFLERYTDRQFTESMKSAFLSMRPGNPAK